MFDGRPSETYSPRQLERVGMFSAAWDLPKNKPLSAIDRAKTEETIRKVHRMNRKMRFWATADTPETWKMLMDMGVDFINTDKINELAEFLKRSQSN
jgi:alkaline phosphatase